MRYHRFEIEKYLREKFNFSKKESRTVTCNTINRNKLANVEYGVYDVDLTYFDAPAQSYMANKAEGRYRRQRKNRARSIVKVVEKVVEKTTGLVENLSPNVMMVLRVNAKKFNTTIPLIAAGIVNKHVEAMIENTINNMDVV